MRLRESLRAYFRSAPRLLTPSRISWNDCMATTASTEWLQTLADATRVRLLLLLAGQELSVSELCAIVQMPQSTVSRHLEAAGC